MRDWNVLQGVVRIIRAGTPGEAKAIFDAQLREAGFDPYDGLSDLLPESYEQVFCSREDTVIYQEGMTVEELWDVTVHFLQHAETATAAMERVQRGLDEGLNWQSMEAGKADGAEG